MLNFWCVTGSLALSVSLMVGFQYKRLTLPSQSDNMMYLSAYILTTGIGQVLNFVLLEYLSFIAIGIIINLEIPMGTLCQYVLATDLQPIKGGIFDLLGTIIIVFGLMLPAVGELWSLRFNQKIKGEEDTQLLSSSNKK